MNNERLARTWPAVRDVLLFFGGMAGFAHETVIQAGERPSLLILCAAMMGLPAFLRADEQRRLKDDA